jgi:hypothetical protein
VQIVGHAQNITIRTITETKVEQFIEVSNATNSSLVGPAAAQPTETIKQHSFQKVNGSDGLVHAITSDFVSTITSTKSGH